MADRHSHTEGTGTAGAMLRYAPSRFVEPLLGLLSLPILTRVLGTEGYGHLSILLLTVALIRSIAFNWVGNCALRFRSTLADDLDRFFPNIIAGLAISMALGGGVLYLLQGAFTDGALMIVGAYIWWLFAEAVFSGFAFCGEMVLRATHRPVAFTMSRISQGVSRHVLAVAGLLLLSGDMSVYFGFRVLGLALVSWWSWVTIGAFRHLRWRRISLATQKEFLWFGFPLAVMLLANTLRLIANRYVVLWLDGPESTGLYSAAVNIGSAPLLIFQQVVMLGLYPLAIDAWDKGQSILPFVRDGLRYYFLAGLPALVGLSMLAEPVLALVAGRQYAEAWPVLVLLAGASFLYGISQYFSLQFMVAKRTGTMALIGIFTGVLNVALSLLLVARYGYLAAAWATVVANIVLLAGMMIWGLKPWREAIPWRAAFNSLVSVAAMVLVITVLNHMVGVDGIPSLVLKIIVSAGVYALVLWKSGEISGELVQIRHRWRNLVGRKQ